MRLLFVRVVTGIVLALLLVPCPAEAQRLFDDGLRELADQIAAGMGKAQKRRIAVAALRDVSTSQATVLSVAIAEELTTRLVNAPGLEVVERAMLDKVMAELKLGSSGAIDPATARQVGKVAGVDAIVTGTITDAQSTVSVNLRVIDVETGRIFAAAQTRLVKDDDLRAIMRPTGDPSAVPLAPSLDSRRAPPAVGGSAKKSIATVQGLEFELDRCAREGRAGTGSVVCIMWITNHRPDRNFFIGSGVGVVGFRCWDDVGNEYVGRRITVGNREMDPLGVTLISGVRTRAAFYVEGNVTGRTLSRMRLSVGTSDVGFFDVVLTELPIG